MPIRPGKPLEPLDIVPYSTFLRPVPVPAEGFHDGNQICVTFSESWRSYILGALEILRWRDIWDGSPEDVALTLDRVEELYAHFATGSCTDMTSFYDIRGVGCTLEIRRTSEGPWEQIADFSECGAVGPPGPPGPQGEPGADADPVDCGVCDEAYSGEGPQEAVTLEDEENACGFAAGMAQWIHGEFEGSLVLANQLFQAAEKFAIIALRLFESIPIIGSVASAILPFAEMAGDITLELLEYAESDLWHDWIREKAYCFFLCHQTVTLETMQDFKQYMIDQSIFLPPQGPLLVVIGPVFAGFAVGWHPPTLQVRGAFYATEESIDCIEFECDECPCAGFDFSVTDGNFVTMMGGGLPYSEWEDGTGWVSVCNTENYGGTHAINIKRTGMAASRVTRIEIVYDAVAGTGWKGPYPYSITGWRNGGQVLYAETEPVFGTDLVFAWDGGETSVEIDEIKIEIWANRGDCTGSATLKTLEMDCA